jgi:hypothetical protein
MLRAHTNFASKNCFRLPGVAGKRTGIPVQAISLACCFEREQPPLVEQPIQRNITSGLKQLDIRSGGLYLLKLGRGKVQTRHDRSFVSF